VAGCDERREGGEEESRRKPVSLTTGRAQSSCLCRWFSVCRAGRRYFLKRQRCGRKAGER